MTRNEEFFQGKQPAAVLKHALLKEYVTVFASVVGSQRPRRPIWVIDGYAGAGAYEDPDPEGQNADGSPLVLLKAAQGLTKRDVRGIFIEAKPEIAAQLERNVAPYQIRKQAATVLKGTAEERLPEALDLVGDDPLVTFLDPFGISMSRQMMIETLLSHRERSRSTEVILNINLEAVRRIGGNLQLVKGRIEPKQGQESGIRRTDEFFGGEWWRHSFFEQRGETGSAARAADAVVREYRQRIADETQFASISIPVRRRPRNEALFHLTLFYRHPLGGYKFADAASRATKKWRDTYRRESHREFFENGIQPTLFEGEDQQQMSDDEWSRQEAEIEEACVKQIANTIQNTAETRINVVKDIATILSEVIGLAGESHIRKAWDRLASEGVVQQRDTALRPQQWEIVRI